MFPLLCDMTSGLPKTTPPTLKWTEWADVDSPNVCTSTGAGLYALGVAVSRDNVHRTYIGKAVSLSRRIKQYRNTGSHLERKFIGPAKALGMHLFVRTATWNRQDLGGKEKELITTAALPWNTQHNPKQRDSLRLYNAVVLGFGARKLSADDAFLTFF